LCDVHYLNVEINSKCKTNIQFTNFSKLTAGIVHRFWAGIFAFRFLVGARDF